MSLQQNSRFTCHVLSQQGDIELWKQQDVRSMPARGSRHYECIGHTCDTTGMSASESHQHWSGCHPTAHGSVKDDLFPNTSQPDNDWTFFMRSIAAWGCHNRPSPSHPLQKMAARCAIYMGYSTLILFTPKSTTLCGFDYERLKKI